MKRVLFFIFLSLLTSSIANAQAMSDDAVVAYVKSGVRQGKSQQQLYKELMLKGVTTTQLQRIKDKYEQEKNQAAANKGTALEALCRHLGVTMEETIAFGDGTNDLTMLRAAGLGVAMGNAAPEVKAAADMVTDDNEHSGVAKVIRKIL